MFQIKCFQMKHLISFGKFRDGRVFAAKEEFFAARFLVVSHVHPGTENFSVYIQFLQL